MANTSEKGDKDVLSSEKQYINYQKVLKKLMSREMVRYK